MVEHLPSIGEFLGSIPSKNNKSLLGSYNVCPSGIFTIVLQWGNYNFKSMLIYVPTSVPIARVSSLPG